MKDQIQVFYDGLCRLCSREIDTYKRMRGADKIQFIDITSREFNAESQGLDPHKVHKHLHAKGRDGVLHVGVDAFILIWKQLDALTWAATLAGQRPIKKILEIAYASFAVVRPLLPRKECEDSPYCDLRSTR